MSEQTIVFEKPNIDKSKSRSSIKENKKKLFHWLPKRPNRVSILIGVGIVCLIGVHLLLRSMYSPEHTVKVFQRAVEENQINKVTDILEKGGTSASLDDQSVKLFTQYLKDTDLVNHLTDLVTNYKNGKGVLKDHNGNKILTLQKSGKFLGLYQKYSISAEPFDLVLNSPIDGVGIELNGKRTNSTIKDGEITFHKLLPGEYQVKAFFQNDYSTLKEKDELNFATATNNKLVKDLEFNADYVEIYSNEPEAVLLIDGKNTGKKIVAGEKYGPFTLDGKTVVSAQVERDGQTIRTKDVPVTGKYVDLLFEPAEPKKAPEQENNGFFSSIKNFFSKYLPGSSSSDNDLEEKQLINGLFDHNSQPFLQSADYQQMINKQGSTQKLLQFSVIDSKQDDQGMEIKSQEQYEITDKYGNTNQKKFEIRYRFVRENNQLKLSSIEEVKDITNNE
jgi:uncharacterized membrane protein YvbJ